MNYFIAKKKRTNNTYFKVLTTEIAIYSIPDDLNNPITFSNSHNLDEDAWFGIPNFKSSEFAIELLNQEFNSTDYNTIGFNDYRFVKYFCAYQDNNYYCFQNFNNSSVINRKYFNLTGEPVIKTNEPILIIKQVPDAIYVKSEDVLYFKKHPQIPHLSPKQDFSKRLQFLHIFNLSFSVFLSTKIYFLSLENKYFINCKKSKIKYLNTLI